MKGNVLNFTASVAVPAFRFVALGTTEGSVALASAGGDAIGVSYELDAAQGARQDVQFDGIAEVTAGGAFAVGAKLKVGSNGKAVAASAGDAYVAVALDSATADGDVVRIKLEKGAATNETTFKAEEAIGKNLFVKAGTDTDKVKKGTSGAAVLGVSGDEDTASGSNIVVQTSGNVKVLAGGTVAVGDRIVCDANGKAVAAGASAETYGVALTAGASGDLITVAFGYAGKTAAGV
ncbi:capsid cement protein [Fibrobacter sp.]|uniref:capsid cement protein n=1 Tax=Fibrobacter sp. TaxID=35828 RepID=UPI0025BF2642|nr:capsid cement protein [Fibrobacter sp.]MBR3070254.1 DUF2190 family protein [Fibrobacter sp.]